jgi:molecular chaperone GrpE
MMTNDSKRFEENAAGASDPNVRPAVPDPAATATGGGADAEATILKAQIADLTDRLLRAHAEMDNIRKRSEREKADTHKYAVTKFAQDVITVGDNVQRAIEAVPTAAAEQDPALKSFLDGITVTERELVNVLERHGIRRMAAHGEAFNPHLHQAVMEVNDESVPAGTVVQVLQAGYMIEDRTLRPAMVAVAKGGARPMRQDGSAAAVDSPANDDPAPGEIEPPGGEHGNA